MARFGEIPPTPLYKGGNIIYGQVLKLPHGEESSGQSGTNCQRGEHLQFWGSRQRFENEISEFPSGLAFQREESFSECRGSKILISPLLERREGRKFERFSEKKSISDFGSV